MPTEITVFKSHATLKEIFQSEIKSKFQTWFLFVCFFPSSLLDITYTLRTRDEKKENTLESLKSILPTSKSVESS